MKKNSFTLIELMVTVGIVILIAATSGPALDSARNRSNLDAAVQQIRDLISQTQSYAFAPERPEASDYLLVLNFGTTDVTVNGTDPSCSITTDPVTPQTYGFFVVPESTALHPGLISPCGRILLKSGPLPSGPSYQINYLATRADLKVHFRTTDGVAGFDGTYGGGTFADPNYAEISLSLGDQTKKVRTNKITGQTEICLCTTDACGLGECDPI